LRTASSGRRGCIHLILIKLVLPEILSSIESATPLIFRDHATETTVSIETSAIITRSLLTRNYSTGSSARI
jgi:hypothetical protein